MTAAVLYNICQSGRVQLLMWWDMNSEVMLLAAILSLRRYIAILQSWKIRIASDLTYLSEGAGGAVGN